MNVYGKTKLAGEKFIEAVGGKYFIFRTSWVYGPHGHNFLRTMLRLGRDRDHLKIVDDQFGAPTSSIAIANATRAAVDKAVDGPAPYGAYHLSCGGETTWCRFAREIFAQHQKKSGGKSPEVTAIPSSEYPTPATRPVNSVLSNKKLHSELKVTLPEWQDALLETMEALKE